jgi:hypothetical protein
MSATIEGIHAPANQRDHYESDKIEPFTREGIVIHTPVRWAALSTPSRQ